MGGGPGCTAGAALEAGQQPGADAAAAQRAGEAETEEAVPDGRMGGRANRHLRVHHPAEHGQAAARGGLPQGPDLRHAGRGHQRSG